MKTKLLILIQLLILNHVSVDAQFRFDNLPKRNKPDSFESMLYKAPESAKFTIDTDKYLISAQNKTDGDTAIYGFIGKRNSRGTACSLMVSESDLEKHGKPTLKQIMNTMCSEGKKVFKNHKRGKIKKIKINGSKFLRTKWSGTLKGLDLVGYYLCTRKGNLYFTIVIQDTKDQAVNSQPKCKSIMKTFKIK